MKYILSIALMLAMVASAEKMPLERYQSVIDRQMFGQLPAGFDPTKLPSEVQKNGRAGKELTPEQEKIKSSVKFSAIDRKADGTVKVGFTDSSDPKDPRSYYMMVGETKNGWTVVAADADDATMTIEKDGITLDMTLGDDSATGAGTAAKGGNNRPPITTLGAANSSFMGFRGRRRQREEDMQRREAALKAQEENRKAQEEARKQKDEESAAERAAMQQQLSDISAELKRARAEKEKAEKEEEKSDENNDAE